MIDRSTWPTDERFRRFAAVIADSVQGAISRGVVIGHASVGGGTECRCPLGTLTADQFPFSALATKRLRELGVVPPLAGCFAFIVGFDSKDTWRGDSAITPYFNLGRAYREWAMKREGKKP